MTRCTAPTIPASRRAHPGAIALALLLLAAGSSGRCRAADAPGAESRKAVTILGAATFSPTPEHVVGWRGDGSGRFPGATPPIAWSRQVRDGRAESSGMRWMTPIPSGASSPIVVGERIFFGFGRSGLMCVGKADGRILWYHTHSYYEVMTEEERRAIDDRAKPLFAAIQARMAAEMKRMSDAVSPAGYPDDKRFMGEQFNRELAEPMKQLDALVLEVGKDRYRTGSWHDWEWSSATPVSDGTSVFMWFSHRVAVCYDLDGNRIWATHEPAEDITYAESHGRHSSPVLCGDRLIVQYGHEVIAFERKTGKLSWHASQTKTPHWICPLYGSLVLGYDAGQPYVVTCMGEAFRVADGERGWGFYKDFAGENTSAVVEGSHLFIYDRSGLIQLLMPPAPGASAQLAMGRSLAFERGKDNYMIASPLVVNGLVYAVSDKGLLSVFDPDAGSLVYEKPLPLNPHIEYIFYPGYAASPALAGKHLYLLDNQGGTVIIEPGRVYKEIASNRIETFEKRSKDRDGKESVVYEQTVSNPVFDGKLMIIRGQQYLYGIGPR